MKTITLDTAKAIAADWHGGQWTALYAFASSGIADARAGDHVAEIEAAFNRPGISRRDTLRLEKLKRFIKAKTVNTPMNDLIRQLSDEGLKETRDIALHTEDITDFIWYMETDLAERQRALNIAQELHTRDKGIH